MTPRQEASNTMHLLFWVLAGLALLVVLGTADYSTPTPPAPPADQWVCSAATNTCAPPLSITTGR